MHPAEGTKKFLNLLYVWVVKWPNSRDTNAGKCFTRCDINLDRISRFSPQRVWTASGGFQNQLCSISCLPWTFRPGCFAVWNVKDASCFRGLEQEDLWNSSHTHTHTHTHTSTHMKTKAHSAWKKAYLEATILVFIDSVCCFKTGHTACSRNEPNSLTLMAFILVLKQILLRQRGTSHTHHIYIST